MGDVSVPGVGRAKQSDMEPIRALWEEMAGGSWEDVDTCPHCKYPFYAHAFNFDRGDHDYIASTGLADEMNTTQAICYMVEAKDRTRRWPNLPPQFDHAWARPGGVVTRIPAEAKILPLVDESPYHPTRDFHRAYRWSLINDEMTVGEFLDIGGRWRDLLDYLANGYVMLEGEDVAEGKMSDREWAKFRERWLNKGMPRNLVPAPSKFRKLVNGK